MLQRVAIQCLRGFKGNPISAWVKSGSDEFKKYREGVHDRKKAYLTVT